MKILIRFDGIPEIWDQNDMTVITCAICNKDIPHRLCHVSGKDLSSHIKCSEFLVEGSTSWN